MVWLREGSFFSPSGGNQRVIWKLAVYPAIDAGLDSSEVYVPRLVKARIESFPQASTYVIIVI